MLRCATVAAGEVSRYSKTRFDCPYYEVETTLRVNRAAVRTLLIFLIVICAGAVLSIWLVNRADESPEPSLSLSAALSADTTGYERARGPRPFQFPQDHGAHPDFRTEWWYYTGNVQTEAGRHFGYQFTIFRTALTPQTSDDASSLDSAGARLPTENLPKAEPSRTWSTNQLYMAHFAVTDVASAEHYAYERFSRGAAGLAGTRSDPFRVWIEDWEIAGIRGADSVRIRAEADEIGLDLVLSRTKPIVLQGEEGYDRKGSQPGNASFYYSMTRMATSGTIHAAGTAVDVNGWSWLDREWGTSALAEDQVGWDWFSLQLQNDVEVMYYRIRQDDGSTSPYSGGVVVRPDGGTTAIAHDDIQLNVLETWESPSGTARYPAQWRIRVPTLEIDFHVEPLVADQELDTSIRYWEGAVHVEGTYGGAPVEGFGFVELTGYDDNEGDHARL